MPSTRMTLATAGTVTALAVLGAVAFAAGRDTAPAAPVKTLTPVTQVRTIVEHRTVNEVRHVKAKARKVPAAQPSAAPPAPAATTAPRAVPIAQTRTTVAPKPLRTATSGAPGGTSGERESDRGDGSEQGDD